MMVIFLMAMMLRGMTSERRITVVIAITCHHGSPVQESHVNRIGLIGSEIDNRKHTCILGKKRREISRRIEELRKFNILIVIR